MYFTHPPQGKATKPWLRPVMALAPFLLLSGCAGMSNTDAGVLGGAGVGAVTGAVVGHALGNTAAGAVIGAGVGGIAGGVTGNAVDRAEAKAEARAVAAQQQRAALQLTDVVTMTQQGVSDAVIIEQIRLSGAIYQLTAQHILWLKQNGVHEPVIREMQLSAYNRQPPGDPIYGPGAVYVADPYGYPPPPRVGVGFTYFGGGRRWR